jgi:acetolactate synthase-1/2/3 large subunit
VLGYPVKNTKIGLGAFPASDPQFTAIRGKHGTYESNMANPNSDVLLAIGARFDDRVTGKLSEFAPRAKFVHIDVDPAEISKNVPAHIPIVGDAKNVLGRLVSEYRALGTDPARLAEWWERIERWRSQHPLRYDDTTDAEIKPQRLLEALYEATGGHAILSTDVGQHQMWAAQYFHFPEPRRWINSGGLGTMGFGLPAAMGVQLVNPGATVACVTGEASIQMCIQELSTCKQYHLPIKVINLNNRYMGMVRQWQEFFYGNRYAESYMDALPDFVKLAEAYGHVGMKIEKPGDIDGALREAFAQKERLVFMDFITDQTENVFPMVPGGKGLTEMILAEEL